VKLVLRIYTDEWSNTEVQVAWVALDRSTNSLLLSYKGVFEELQKWLGSEVITLTLVDYTLVFLAAVHRGTEEDDDYYIDTDGNELDIYSFENDFTILRDDQTYPEESPQKMTITYLHVEKNGVRWESRDDLTEDLVETSTLTWEDLERFKQQLEAVPDGSKA
jgi:hypothetical protein